MTKLGRRVGVSGYPGVWPAKTAGKWLAIYRHKNKQIYAGTFPTAADAYKGWLDKGFELTGEYPDAGKNYTIQEQAVDIELIKSLSQVGSTPLERGLNAIDRCIKEAL